MKRDIYTRRLIRALIIFFILSSQIDIEAQSFDFESKMLNVCLLQTLNGNIGTGILIVDSNKIYVVSARHVLFDNEEYSEVPKFTLKDDYLYVISHARDIQNSTSDSLIIDLKDLYMKGLLKYDLSNDAASIQLGDIQLDHSGHPVVKYHTAVERVDRTPTRLNFFDSRELKENGDLKIGDDIIVIGYPRAIGLARRKQYDYDKPLIRKGSIAGINNQLSTYIIDCPIYKGNSGGPVLKYYDEFLIDNDGIGFINHYELIGIISQFIPYEERWTNKDYNITNVEWDNSGYAVVVPIKFIMNLIKSYR